MDKRVMDQLELGRLWNPVKAVTPAYQVVRLLEYIDYLEEQLFRCAEVSGADTSGGRPTSPDIGTYAVEAVAQLRADHEAPTEYRTKTGRVLTDADIEALADEAEKGYPVEHLQFGPGRPADR